MSDGIREKPVRALAHDEHGNPIYIVGLAEEHLEHVRAGRTVLVEMTAFGHRGLIMIYGGKDQADLLRQIEPALNPGSVFIDGVRRPRRS